MTIWTIYVTTISDPGQVPLYWGFYIGDPESMRCRYCLMCNVFKPIRCHHCSMCNRCVLNMDHHCPWINNCIGFYNRKFFMQMVFYLNCTLIFILITNLKHSINFVKYCYNNKIKFNGDFIGKISHFLLYLIDIVMEIILIQFFKFHVKLILENKTTIETLDHKGQEFKSKYDQGKWENWIEVMGINKYLWFVPLKLYYGKPKGNGIDWVELPEEQLNNNIDNPDEKNNNIDNNDVSDINDINNNNINVHLVKEDVSSDITGDHSRNLMNK
jgi:palmitoyltransferase